MFAVRTRPWLSFTCAIAISSFTHGALADPRSDFVAAEQAYERGDMGRYQQLKRQLADYPLLPYLEYAELSDSLPTAGVKSFLDAHAGSALDARLRGQWLDRLAKEGRWSEYVVDYDPSAGSDARRCRYAVALQRTGKRDQAFSEAAELWRYGGSRPDDCNPVFQAWRAAGGLTPALAWERIALAMDNGSTRLARYLGKYLPPSERRWLDLWLDLDEHPERIAQPALLSGDHDYKKAMIAHAIKRLGKTDPHRAADIWRNYRDSAGFSEEEACAVDENLGYRLEDEPDDEAYRFFVRMAPCPASERLHEARIRSALLREDLPAVTRWIDEIPAASRDEDRWLYWKGRALEAAGKKTAADRLYRQAAEERTYYGFLAADRVGAAYRADHVPISAPADTVRRVLELPAMRRMKELLALGREIDARREWRHLVPGLTDDELKAAAKAFHDWGWLDRAIFTAARAEYWDDLEVRFPLRYAGQVKAYAGRRDLDPSWVFGVLRQESAFMSDVRSSAGAVGLMQLLPATASQVAKRFGMASPGNSALLDPETNIALGTGYLRMMLDDLGDHPVLATAAYNAGPHRVKRWMPERRLDAAIWAELIPFKETRLYVQRVMAYSVIYEQRLGMKSTRLSSRMKPVPG